MALVGSLRDLNLAELLAVISGGEKSGVITIRSDAGTAQIHVHDGRIVLASDTLRDERFGEVLLKLGKISPEVLTMDDLPALERTPALFARKFDTTTDAAVLDEIDDRLLAPASEEAA